MISNDSLFPRARHTAILALTACGSNPGPGTTPGEQGAREVAAAWYTAMARNDGDTACDLMTGSFRTEFITAAHTTTCEDSVRAYGETLDVQANAAIKAKSFKLTTKSDDYMTVELNTTTTVETFAISWTTDRWMLSDVVG